MKTQRRVGSWRRVLFLALLVSLPSTGALAAPDKAGVISALTGDVSIKDKAGAVRSAPKVGVPVLAGDEIQTGKRGFVRLLFNDDSVITIGADSRFAVTSFSFDQTASSRKGLFQLFIGKMKVVTKKMNNWQQNIFEVKTPSAIAGVRGTSFLVTVTEEGYTAVLTLTGEVQIFSPDGGLIQGQEVILRPKMRALIGDGTLHTELLGDEDFDDATGGFDDDGSSGDDDDGGDDGIPDGGLNPDGLDFNQEPEAALETIRLHIKFKINK